MQTGIARIADYFGKEGVKIGAVRGFIGGTVAGASLILLIRKIKKEYQKHKEEGEAILKGLEEGMKDYDNQKLQSIKMEGNMNSTCIECGGQLE